MRYGIRLSRLALAIVESAAQPIVAGISHRRQRIPELLVRRLIRNIIQHADDLPVLDLIEQLPAELEIIPLLIDGETAVADNINALLHILDDVVDTLLLLTRHQRYIGHPLKLHIRPA